MAVQRGRNGGITGLIDIAGAPKFHAFLSGFSQSLTMGRKGRNGRGSGRWTKSRALRPGGQLVVRGTVQNKGYPLPTEWKGQEGTITATYHGGATQILTVAVTSARIDLQSDAEDKWKIKLTCEILANPTFSGFGGDQPAATDPAQSNQELADGHIKAIDPKNLTTSGMLQYDVWPLGETDAAERQSIADLIAAVVAPITGGKVRMARLEPGRDFDGGTVTIEFGLTDTEEDVVNPATATTLDPQGLTSQATAVGVFSAPTAPGGDLVARETTTQEIHDGATRTQINYGLLDTRQSVEFPGTITGNDPFDLADQARITTVHDTSAIPADPIAPLGQLVERETVRINRIRWQTVWKYSNLNSEQRIEFPAAVLSTDPSALQDIDHQSDVTDSSTPPVTPASRFTDGKLRRITSRRVGGTPEKWLHVWEFGRRTTEQDITFPGTVTSDEVSNLADEATVTLVNASAVPPATPAAPVGQLLAIESEQIHGSNGGKWRHTFKYGNTTAAQRLTFSDSPVEDDPTDLADTEAINSLSGSSAAPATPTPSIADLKLKRRKSVRVAGTPEQWQHTFYFARNNEKDETELRGANTTADPNDLDETAVIRNVTNSATPPAAPAAPVGVLIDTITEPLTVASGAYTGYWVHTFKYGPTTRLQRIEFNADLIVDPSSIADADVIPVVTTSSAPPATPTPRTVDLKLRRRRSRRIQGTPERWVHTFEFGRNTEEDEREHPRRDADPDGFGITERIPILHTSETVSPGTPAQIGTASNLVGTDVERLCVPNGLFTGLWMWTFSFGPTTRKQAIEQEGDIEADPALLDDDDTQTLTNGSSAPPATPAARITGQVLARRSSRRIQNTPEKWRHTFRFAYRNSASKLVSDRTTTDEDPSALQSSAVTAAVWLVSGVAPATPTLSGYVLRNKIDLETSNPLYRLRVYRWGLRSTKDDIEMDGTLASYTATLAGTTTTVSVVDHAGTAQALADTLFASNRTDLAFDRLAVRKLTADKAMQTIITKDNYALVKGQVSGGLQPVRCIHSGSVKVWLSRKILRGTALTHALIEPQLLWRTQNVFALRRKYIASVAPDHRSLVGKSNAAEFMGYPALTVTYLGAGIEANIAITAPRQIEMVYFFAFDSLGAINEYGISMGWVLTDANLSAFNENSWVAASVFGWTDAALLPSGDFTPFVTI